MAPGQFLFFEAQFSSEGSSYAWREGGTIWSFGVELFLALKIGIKNQKKKVFVIKSEATTWCLLNLTCFFCPRKKLYSYLGKQAMIWVEETARNANPWNWGCYFLLGHNSGLKGHISRLEGAQAMI